MKTGVIGLGAMGAGMALSLHKAGHLHGVWNRSRSKTEALIDAIKAPAMDSPASLAATCELIIMSISRDDDVLEMVEQIATSVKPGTIIADTSTISSATAIEAAKILKHRNAEFLDCPVSGGVEGARGGTLVIMAGGDGDALERARPALSAIAGTITLIGPTGSGQACKAVNQIMCAGINQGVTEALAFGEAMGLDMEKVVKTVAKGAAGNWFLERRGKTMLANNNKVGFKLNLHHKDLRICKAMAQDLDGISLPLVDKTLAHYETLMAQGYGDEDISALYRLKRPGPS